MALEARHKQIKPSVWSNSASAGSQQKSLQKQNNGNRVLRLLSPHIGEMWRQRCPPHLRRCCCHPKSTQEAWSRLISACSCTQSVVQDIEGQGVIFPRTFLPRAPRRSRCRAVGCVGVSPPHLSWQAAREWPGLAVAGLCEDLADVRQGSVDAVGGGDWQREEGGRESPGCGYRATKALAARARNAAGTARARHRASKHTKRPMAATRAPAFGQTRAERPALGAHADLWCFSLLPYSSKAPHSGIALAPIWQRHAKAVQEQDPELLLGMARSGRVGTTVIAQLAPGTTMGQLFWT